MKRAHATHEKRVGIYRKLCLSAFLPLALFYSAFAQDSQTITGTVTDAETGSTLPGVNILVVGTTSGTTTNSNGEFELTADDANASLRFTYIGYEELEVPLEGRTTLDVVLTPTIFSADELVVVGYTTQERRNISGSIAVVEVENMNTISSGQVTRGLQGSASGVTVVSSGQPGDSPKVRIRGINTFGDDTPLYIVDGVPTQDIENLNPQDIESMSVLKDAASASIYGARAANGVIVITTQRGQGAVQVNYNGYTGYDIPHSGNVWNLLNPQEMAQLRWMAIENSGGDPRPDPQYGSGAEPVLPDYLMPAGAMEGEVDHSSYYLIPEYSDPSQLSTFNQIVRANHEGTNWYEEIFSPALSMNHDISVSGGGEQGNFYVSLNHLDQQGTLKNTYNRRSTIRANSQFNVSENFRIGENLAFSQTNNPTVNTLTEGSAIGMSFRQQPIIPVYDIMGNFAGSAPTNMGNAHNPLALLERMANNRTDLSRLFGNAYAELDFLNHFSFRSSFGGDLRSISRSSFSYPSYERSENSTTNSFSASSDYRQEWNWSNVLTYQQEIANLHNVEVMVGTEAFRARGQNVGGTTQGYFSFNPNYTNLSTGSGTRTNYSNKFQNSLLSFFGSLNYNYDSRYIISATIRRDGSSRFDRNKWGTFPAASVAWRVTQESFMQDVSWLSELRFRAGMGVMGNEMNVDANNPYTLFAGNQSSSYYPIDGSNSQISLGFEQDRIGNPDARWERNVTGNVGFDAILFNDRVELSAEYYWKDVTDLLFDPELPGTAGAASQPYVNVANMQNHGIDASINTRGNLGNQLQYRAGLNFTSYKNEIVKISEGIDYFTQDGRRFSGSAIIRNEVGQPVSSFYGYQIVGFWNSQSEIDDANANAPSGTYQTDVAVGRFRYADIDGDGEVTPDDRTFLGDPNPDFTYGINLGLDYRNFDFTAFFYGSQGNDIWNNVKWWTDFYSNFDGAKSKRALYDSWTPENQNASLPIQDTGGGFSSSTVPNSYFVEDGSYLRLRTVVIGYSLPINVTSAIGASRARIYLQGSNLFTLTGYSGLDPEIGGGNTNYGIDEGAYAPARQLLLGLNLSF